MLFKCNLHHIKYSLAIYIYVWGISNSHLMFYFILFLGNIVLDSSVKLKNDWSNQLYNSSSDFYKTLSKNYTQEVCMFIFSHKHQWTKNINEQKTVKCNHC